MFRTAAGRHHCPSFNASGRHHYHVSLATGRRRCPIFSGLRTQRLGLQAPRQLNKEPCREYTALRAGPSTGMRQDPKSFQKRVNKASGIPIISCTSKREPSEIPTVSKKAMIVPLGIPEISDERVACAIFFHAHFTTCFFALDFNGLQHRRSES